MAYQEEAKGPSSPPVSEDLGALLECLPRAIRRSVEEQADLPWLLEVVLDLGRLPEARFAGREVYLGDREVTQEDIRYVIERVSPFGDDNRAGIERTLHRVSAIRNRVGQVVGLTCRVGRAIFGSVQVASDLVFSGKNILLVGRPGVGKTTMLREMARVLADDARRRVVIVDTSNEIAGDGDVPHPAIGRARRMQVSTPAQQHAVMIEAVENHMPEVIIIDEMGTEQEARAARTIAERGVQLIATAHGNMLENLLINPTLSDLVGGVQTVTLSDEEARRRRTQKAVLERKAPPTFDVLIEIQGWYQVAVHLDVAETVDRLLRGQAVTPEVRWLEESGEVHHARQHRTTGTPVIWDRSGPTSVPARQVSAGTGQPPGSVAVPAPAPPGVNVHLLGVNREHLAQAVEAVGIPLEVTDSLARADLVLTTKVYFRRGGGVLRRAEEAGVPVFVLRRNTEPQIRSFLEQAARQLASGELGSKANGMLATGGGGQEEESVKAAVRETEHGIQRILNGQMATVELGPQSAYVRRIQHGIAEQAQLRSRSSGREPRRRVVIRGS